MYESPITLTEQIADEVRVNTERTLVEYVRKIGFNVDKCELERALLYDRRQYEKGYNDGYHDGQRWCCGMNSNVIYWRQLPEAPKEA